jgi:dTDP-glucose pyrophosphorylase
MINIAIPMAGSSIFFPEKEINFSKLFYEINGTPIIQLVIENLNGIKKFDSIKFTFVINEVDDRKYNLSNVLKMLTKNNCDIVIQRNQTMGAICSLLLAIEYLNNSSSLVISNVDQVIDYNFSDILETLKLEAAVGGLICFDSIHPQWSFARIIEKNKVIETAEKNPISQNAIAGFYYYQRSLDFLNSSMKVIIKNRSYNGKYYISSTFNELILDGKNVRSFKIPASAYHSFYSPAKIREYENYLSSIGK